MTTRRVSDFLQRLRHTFQRREGAEQTDGQLLTEFVQRREATAVAALVGRHGPMVWGVCRRVLHNYHDVEDAFQAAFLVLVRRAASVQPPEMVANWLYGVAYQTALKARATAAKRQTRERQVSVLPDPATVEPEQPSEMHLLLDQEVHRLPDKYRVVVLLCDLEGKTRQEAARHLGWPEGTVAGRLARARALLAKRLARHGLAAAGTALAAVLPGTVAACAPETVVAATIKNASLVAAGHVSAAAASIPVQVATLTEGVLQTLLLGKLKLVGVLLACVCAGGLVLHLHPAPSSTRGPTLAGGKATPPGTKAPPPPAPASHWQRYLKAHLAQIQSLFGAAPDKPAPAPQ